MKKMLLMHPNNSQMKTIVSEIEADVFFSENFEILKYPSLKTKKYKNNDLSEFDLIISPVHFNTINDKYVKKNRRQIVIELTHGTWIKRLNPMLSKKRGGINYIVSTCEWATKVYKENGYSDSEIIKVDQPRHSYYRTLDIEEIKNKLCKLYGFDKSDDIVIYAPSWLKANKKIKVNIEKIISNLSGDEKLLVLPHINTNKKRNIKYEFDNKFKSKVKIDTRGKIKAEIAMLASSKLITDYSSIIYDYVNLFPEKKYEFFFPDVEDSSLKKIYDMQYNAWGKIDNLSINKEQPNILIPELKYYKNEKTPEQIIIEKIKGIKLFNS